MRFIISLTDYEGFDHFLMFCDVFSCVLRQQALADWRKMCQKNHRLYLEKPLEFSGKTDFDGLNKAMGVWGRRLAQKKPTQQKQVEEVEETYQQQSIEELKAATDKEVADTGEESGPATMAYLDMLEQQRAMNPEAAIGELENVGELWTPQTSPDEVAAA